MGAIIKTEFRLLLREPAFLISAILLLLMTLAASSLGAQRVEDEREVLAAARSTEMMTRAAYARDADAVARMTPEAAALVKPLGEAPGQPYAGSMAGPVGLRLLPVASVLEPAPLAFAAVGLSDVRPPIFNVIAAPPFKFMTNYELENPLLLSIGTFDFAFVILFILPIVVLAANYNLLSADRDAGIMAMVLAQPVRPVVYAGARLAVRGVAIGALAIVAWGIALVAGDADLSIAGADTAALILLGVMLVYSAFWLVLALAVNLAVRSAATCGLALAGLWLWLVVIVPAGVSLLATGTISAPSRVALTADARDAAQQADRDRAKSLANFFVDHPEMAAVQPDPSAGDPFSRGVLVGDAAVHDAVGPTLAAFDRASARRQALVEKLQFLSPTLIAQIAIEDVAGRGSERYAAFKEKMLRFNEVWRRFFAPMIMGTGRLTPADYRVMPRWQSASSKNWPLSSLNELGLLALLGVLLIAITLSLRAVRSLTP